MIICVPCLLYFAFQSKKSAICNRPSYTVHRNSYIKTLVHLHKNGVYLIFVYPYHISETVCVNIVTREDVPGIGLKNATSRLAH
jgi:hypothetical protein